LLNPTIAIAISVDELLSQPHLSRASQKSPYQRSVQIVREKALTSRSLSRPETHRTRWLRSRSHPRITLIITTSFRFLTPPIATNNSTIDGDNQWVWRDWLKDNPVDERLAHILDRMVAPKLSQRYQSVDRVLKALNTQPSPPKSRLMANNTPYLVLTNKPILMSETPSLVLSTSYSASNQAIYLSPLYCRTLL
jgi:serine/threonine protein kinase